MCDLKRLIAAITIVLLVGCAPGTDSEEIALAELVARQADYDGKTLRVRGIVRTFDAPRHYWLEDGFRNRVGLEPADLIAPHLDRQVSITGQYAFSPDRGRKITVERIESFDTAR